MPGASLALFADLGVCHVQKSSVTICVLPTPFRWRATRFKMLGNHAPIIISIRALRVEGDVSAALITAMERNFYPRPPGGGRHFAAVAVVLHRVFLSTPSGWRATRIVVQTPRVKTFLSTPSGWRATIVFIILISSVCVFLSTPSGWRATSALCRRRFHQGYFYPRPPGGGRLP